MTIIILTLVIIVLTHKVITLSKANTLLVDKKADLYQHIFVLEGEYEYLKEDKAQYKTMIVKRNTKIGELNTRIHTLMVENTRLQRK
jgi:hypothetical protein